MIQQLIRQVSDKPTRLQETYYNEVYSFCSVNLLLSYALFIKTICQRCEVHTLPLLIHCWWHQKSAARPFFLFNHEYIRCLIVQDYTFLRTLNERRFFLAQRYSVCFTVIHTAVIKGLSHRKGEVLPFSINFSISAGAASCLKLQSLSSQNAPELGFGHSGVKHTHAHTCTLGNKEYTVTEMSCLHIEGELDLRWCSLISNYCTCPGTSHCGCSNQRGILKIHKEEHTKI